MHAATSARHWRRLVVVLGVLALLGCGAGPDGDPPPPTPSSSVTATPPSRPVPVPSDGMLLRRFGLSFGPLDSLSLPTTSVVVTSVDQADNVTLVLSAPQGPVLAGYLRRTLPAAGFTVTGDNTALDSLTFTGQGWSGSFTTHGATSALLLRPA